MLYITRTQQRAEQKAASSSKKGDLKIAKNYQGIILTSIVAKIYNAQLLNCIKQETEKILRKNQNYFWRNRSTLQILTIFKGVCALNLETTLLFVDFSKTPYTDERWNKYF